MSICDYLRPVITIVWKMHSMICCHKKSQRLCDPALEIMIFIAKASNEGLSLGICAVSIETLLLSYTNILKIDKSTILRIYIKLHK